MESCDEETAALRERGSGLLLCIGCRPSADVSRKDRASSGYANRQQMMTKGMKSTPEM
jgi:hypothetical protein